MSRKKKVSKSGTVWRRSAVENTLDHMPKYNGYACGHGAHGDSKYNRAKAKRAWQSELEPRGARNRGLLPFFGASTAGSSLFRRATAGSSLFGAAIAGSPSSGSRPRALPLRDRKTHGIFALENAKRGRMANGVTSSQGK